jgi:hypothetical protein
VPSLALVLISGLVSMIVHTPFQNAGWVWLKALLGFPLFVGTLITIDGLAQPWARACCPVWRMLSSDRRSGARISRPASC